MGPASLDTLRWQFELTWRLGQAHLPHLTDEACLWEPAAVCWSVHKDGEGRWRPDWAAKEPDPAPAASIGWITWHMIWWWTGLSVSLNGGKAPHHEAVDWPGSAESTKVMLEQLAQDWRRMLAQISDVDIDRPVTYPWTEPRPLRLALAWCNAELMKNIAEIGTVRHLYELAKKTG